MVPSFLHHDSRENRNYKLLRNMFNDFAQLVEGDALNLLSV
jgi:hypothetical protein